MKHFHRAAEEAETKCISAGGEWKKKDNRKGRAKSRKDLCKAWPSDEQLAAPRRTVKIRENSLSPPSHIKDGCAGTTSELEQESSDVVKSDISKMESLH